MANYSSPPKVATKSIAFGDASIAAADGIKVADLATGDLVTKVWVEIDTAWNSVTSDTMTIGIADEDGTSPTAIATFNAQTASAAVAGDVEVGTPPASLGTSVAEAKTPSKLFVKVVSVGGSLAAGAAIVHALIEPADLVQSAFPAYVAPTPTQSVKQGTPSYQA